MAQDATLQGLRNQYLTQIHGRRLALDPNDYLVGPRDLRLQVSGFSSGGSTVTSTSVASNIDPFGYTVVGATGASATTAYTLAAPVPGVRKVIFNPTTGGVTVLTSAAGALIITTGSITSTFGQFSMAAKGAYVELVGLSTALWGVMGVSQISTGGAGVTFV